MTRTEARELLMQAVFQMEAQKDSSNELFEQLLAEQKADKGNLAYLRTNFENLRRNALEIDDRIDKYSSSDLIQAIIGKTSMKISYILVENRGNYNNIVAYVPAYTGTLVTLDFNKYFTGKTKIYTMVF